MHAPKPTETAAASGTAADAEPAMSKTLTPEAERALAEAAARRAAASGAGAAPAEYGGQQGPDPVRYGDWEKGGIASDF